MFRCLQFARSNHVTTAVRLYYTINFKLLSAYKSEYGNVNVPLKYKVDGSLTSFSNIKSVDGFNLGIHVSNIRQQMKKGLLSSKDVKKLRDMEFVLDPLEEKRRILLLAFRTYIDKFKSTKIRQLFKIAKDDESWPKETRGIALGIVLNKIRFGGYTSIVNEVRAMGINVNNENNCPNFELYFEALKVFNEINGHCKPIQRFVVPEGDVRYNEEAWGIPLGMWLNSVKCNETFSEHKQRLVDLGVDFNLRTILPFEAIYSSLVTYKNIHGDVNVPQRYVIAEGDVRFDEQTWGYCLGPCANNIRNNGYLAAHREKLEALGFDFTPQLKLLPFEDIYSTLVTYKNIHGHLKVPAIFKVPEGDDRYLKQACGFNLGACLRRVRFHGAYAKHADRLIELGVKIELTKNTSDVVV